jgi:hypothetical protein
LWKLRKSQLHKARDEPYTGSVAIKLAYPKLPHTDRIDGHPNVIASAEDEDSCIVQFIMSEQRIFHRRFRLVQENFIDKSRISWLILRCFATFQAFMTEAIPIFSDHLVCMKSSRICRSDFILIPI